MRFLPILLLFFAIGSCKYYKRDVLFKATKEIEAGFSKNSTGISTPKNYLINKGDFIEFQVFTNKGEVLIDPTSEFAKQISGGAAANTSRIKFLIQGDGYSVLPIVGKVKLDSLTVPQCDSVLSSLYSKFYQDAFVLSKISNRRVFILGRGNIGGNAGGGGGGGGSAGALIFELENENISLIEVLAKIGGPGVYSHAERIKVVRGDLRNPTIFTVDMTKWDSFEKSNMIILPNDVIYIEPGRRIAFDFLRDISNLTGLVSAALTFYLILQVYK